MMLGTVSPRTALLATTAVVVVGAAWTVTASATFLYGAGLWDAFPYPSVQFFQYLPYAATNAAVAFWLKASAGISTVLVGGGALRLGWDRLRLAGPEVWRRLGLSRVKPMQRSENDTFGHSDWATPEQARARFSGTDPVHGAMVVAELRRRDQEAVHGTMYDPDNRATWGQGGVAPLLTDPARLRSTHSLWFAGSGIGKSQTILCTLAHPVYRWRTSYIGGDPKCELERKSRKAREAMHHKVYALRPGGEDAINIFAGISPTSRTFEVDVQAATARMFVETVGNRSSGENGKWERWGKMLVNAILADMLTDPACPPESRNPRHLRQALAMSEAALKQILTDISVNSHSRFAREQAQSVIVEAKDTFSGIYVNAQDGTAWLSVPAYADLVSGDSFHPADVCRGDMTVFVQVPPKALKETPSIARCLYGAIMDAVYEADGAVTGRVLFDIDEAYQLGRMNIMETVRDLGRSYGMTLRLWYQSVGQLEELYGREGKRAWYSSAAYRVYAGIGDEDTAKEAMALCGGYTAKVRSAGRNTSVSGRGILQDNATRGTAENVNDARRELARVEEWLQDWADDECLIYSRGMPPIRAGLPIAYRRADMAAAVPSNQPVADVADAA